MFKSALAHVDAGLRAIEGFFEKYKQPDAYEQSSEAQILKALRSEVVQRLPIGNVERLERKLQRALREERYEDAARIRDQIRTIEEHLESES
jgi:protein-arginine kinase activator protein McsA